MTQGRRKPLTRNGKRDNKDVWKDEGSARSSLTQSPSVPSPLEEKSFSPPQLQGLAPVWALPLSPASNNESEKKRRGSPPIRASRSESPAPHYTGHRQRLRERLFQTGPGALQDYELLEMLLFAAIPRRDVKPLAKALRAEFEDLWSLLNAKPERLLSFGLSEPAAALLITTGAIILRAHKQSLLQKPVLSSWQRIVDYCRVAMGHEAKEQFRLLFLDRKNKLFHEEIHQHGTIDHTPVYPREVVQRALELGAGALVLVHNHPSGDTTPSAADIEMTRAIDVACRPLGIVVHDHIIISRDSVASFKALGLL